jgi:hypothetical protein
MNTSNLRSRIIETLLLIVAIAVVARVVGGLLSPMLPTLIVLMLIGTVLTAVLRRR